VVDDLDQAIEQWHRDYDIGPWVFFRDETPLLGSLYRGEQSGIVVIDAAFAYIGDLQIELIQLKQNVPCMYKEVLDRGQKNLQHYGVCVADFTKATEFASANGFIPVVQAGAAGFAQMWYMEATDFSKNVFLEDEQSYIQTPEGHGIVLEIIEYNDFTRPYFEGILNLVNNVPEGELTQQFTISSLMS
jgi:hypothetical protein